MFLRPKSKFRDQSAEKLRLSIYRIQKVFNWVLFRMFTSMTLRENRPRSGVERSEHPSRQKRSVLTCLETQTWKVTWKNIQWTHLSSHKTNKIDTESSMKNVVTALGEEGVKDFVPTVLKR